MKKWENLTKEEKQNARAGRSEYETNQIKNNCLKTTLGLLKNDSAAQRRAWKIAWGNYLINTPDEIAAHLKQAANA